MKEILGLPDEQFEWIDAEKRRQIDVEKDKEVKALGSRLVVKIMDVGYMNANMKWILEEISNPKWSTYHRSVLASLVVLYKIMRGTIEEVAAFVSEYVLPFSPVAMLMKMPTSSTNKNVVHNVISMNCSIIVAYVGIGQNLAEAYVNHDNRRLIEPFVKDCIALYRHHREPLSKFKASHLKKFDEVFGVFEGNFEVGVDIQDSYTLIQRVNLHPNPGDEMEEQVLSLASKIVEKHELLISDDEEAMMTMKAFCVEVIKFFTKLWKRQLKTKNSEETVALKERLFGNLETLFECFRYLGTGQELKTELLISDALYMKELWDSETNTCVVCSLSGTSKCGKCQTIKYCSRECQVRHWKSHRLQCGMANSLDELLSKFTKVRPWPDAEIKDGDIVFYGDK